MMYVSEIRHSCFSRYEYNCWTHKNSRLADLTAGSRARQLDCRENKLSCYATVFYGFEVTLQSSQNVRHCRSAESKGSAHNTPNKLNSSNNHSLLRDFRV